MSSTNRKVRKYEQEAITSLQELFCQYVQECNKDIKNKIPLFNKYNNLWYLKCKAISTRSKGLVKIEQNKFSEINSEHFNTFLKDLQPKKSFWQRIKDKLKLGGK